REGCCCLRYADHCLAECGGIGAGTTVAAVLAVAAVDYRVARVGEVVSVELVVPAVPEKAVVAAPTRRDTAVGKVVSDERAVVSAPAPNHVVAAVCRDHALAGEDGAVAGQVEIVPVAAGDGVVAGSSGDEVARDAIA